MNTNAWILLGALLGLLMELPLGIKVMQNRTSEQKKVYISAMLAVLSEQELARFRDDLADRFRRAALP